MKASCLAIYIAGQKYVSLVTVVSLCVITKGNISQGGVSSLCINIRGLVLQAGDVHTSAYWEAIRVGPFVLR